MDATLRELLRVSAMELDVTAHALRYALAKLTADMDAGGEAHVLARLARIEALIARIATALESH